MANRSVRFEATVLVAMVDVVAFLAACLTPALVSSGHLERVSLRELAPDVSSSVPLNCRALSLGISRLSFVVRALILGVVEVELVFGPP